MPLCASAVSGIDRPKWDWRQVCGLRVCVCVRARACVSVSVDACASCVRVCVRACVRAFVRAFLCVRVVGCHSGPTVASGFSVSSCSSEFETNTSPTAPEPHTNKHTNKPHKQTHRPAAPTAAEGGEGATSERAGFHPYAHHTGGQRSERRGPTKRPFATH